MKKGLYLKIAVLSVLILLAAAVVYPRMSVFIAQADDIQIFEEDPFLEGEENTTEPTVSINTEVPEEVTEVPEEETETEEPIEIVTTEAPVTETGEPTEPTTSDTAEVPTTEESSTEEIPTEEIPTEEVNPTLDITGGELENGLLGEEVEIDREALKAKAKVEYDTYYQKISKFNKDLIDTMLNDIIDRIIDDKLYREETPEEFYNSVMRQNGYISNLIVTAFETLYQTKYPTGTDTSPLDSVVPKVGSDVNVRNYTPYPSVGQGSGGVIPGYINAMTKEVRSEKISVLGDSVDKFRQYEVTLGIDIQGSPEGKQVSNADIVLLIDNSGSMNENIEDAVTAAKKFVDTMLPASYNTTDSKSVKISIISFAGNVSIQSNLTNNRDTLISALDRVRPSITTVDSGRYGTNIQSALMGAKNVLGITDSSFPSDGRKKMVVVFSDGIATTRSTDLWKYSKNYYSSSAISFQTGTNAQAGTKRWSFLTPFGWENKNPIAEFIYLPDGTTRVARTHESEANSDYTKQVDLSSRVTALEAEFMVGQGVELYTVAYNDNSANKDLLKNMTKKMSGTPNFAPTDVNDGYKHNPLESGYSLSDVSGRYFEYNNVNGLINTVSTSLTIQTENKFKSYVIREELAEEFEFDGTSYTLSSKPFGENKISSWGNVVFDGSKLTWSAPNKVEKGTYYLTYKVKVKQTGTLKYGNYFPSGANKEKYGTNAAEAAKLNKISFIEFRELLGNTQKKDFDNLKLTVQPNLQVKFENPFDTYVLLGEEGDITPTIVSSTGFYDCKISQDRSPELGFRPIVIKEEKGVKNPKPYDIIYDIITVGFERPGSYQYSMLVQDLLSGQKENIILYITAKEGILNINILDDKNGTSLEGAFETKISASNAKSEQETYYLAGLGKRKFTYLTGSEFVTRGSTFSASSYVPFGYELVKIWDSFGNTQDGSVTIDLDKLGRGNEQTINVTIRKKSNPKFFYDWSWVIDNVRGSITR